MGGKGSGGKRVGAGRRNGSKNQFSFGNVTFNKSYESYLRRYKVHPLDLFMAIINGELFERDPKTRKVVPVVITIDTMMDAAKAAAPYLHKKREEAAVEPMQYSMDLTKLTDDELIALERMLIKAQRPVFDDDGSNLNQFALDLRRHSFVMFDRVALIGVTLAELIELRLLARSIFRPPWRFLSYYWVLVKIKNLRSSNWIIQEIKPSQRCPRSCGRLSMLIRAR